MSGFPEKWYVGWQSAEHVRHFDFRSALSATNLTRNYQVLNDVQLLNERLAQGHGSETLLEVGCATGEFFRYLQLRWPKVTYCGTDISQCALERARGKYPQGRFLASGASDADLVNVLGLPGKPDFLYSKDVVHHQMAPFSFLERLIETAKNTLVVRLRTRDSGATVFDPELSCQYSYGGWMPYIVMNIDEVVERLLAWRPGAEVVIHRHHMILGGLHSRSLPKDCFLPETGTAETSVAVFLETERPGRVTVKDRPEADPSYTLPHMLGAVLRKARSALGTRSGF